jgi:hypothetical protein
VVEEVPVPLDVRLRFGRAAVQVVADRIGADVLHIKGDAVDPSLRPLNAGTDVDILVRPEDVARLDRAIRGAGWRLYSTFAYGSPFGHAQTYLHDMWGYLDLHRSFPGIGLDKASAFDVLDRDGSLIDEAGIDCRVPSVEAQAILLLLNAARAGGRDNPDVARIWGRASPEERQRLLRLADELRARVALAAATGDLEQYRGAREYALWKSISGGGSRSAEWWGRVRAASSMRDALAVVAQAPRVNIERLTHDLGRAPTRGEVFREFFHRQRRAMAEVRAWARRPRA